MAREFVRIVRHHDIQAWTRGSRPLKARPQLLSPHIFYVIATHMAVFWSNRQVEVQVHRPNLIKSRAFTKCDEQPLLVVALLVLFIVEGGISGLLSTTIVSNCTRPATKAS